MTESLTTLFISQPSSLFVSALAVAALLAMLALPCIVASPSSDFGQTLAALLMYVFQLAGLALIFAGIAPMVLLLANGILPGVEMMQYPVVFLIVGIWLLIHYGHEVQKIDASARALPHAVYETTLHAVGVAMIVLAAFTAAESVLVNYTFGQWDGYLFLAVTGVTLSLLYPIPAKTPKKGMLSKIRRK